ncbi:MAG: hypothetical protein WAT43_03150, partial [Chitinophagales bacterium]
KIHRSRKIPKRRKRPSPNHFRVNKNFPFLEQHHPHSNLLPNLLSAATGLNITIKPQNPRPIYIRHKVQIEVSAHHAAVQLAHQHPPRRTH